MVYQYIIVQYKSPLFMYTLARTFQSQWRSIYALGDRQSFLSILPWATSELSGVIPTWVQLILGEESSPEFSKSNNVGLSLKIFHALKYADPDPITAVISCSSPTRAVSVAAQTQEYHTRAYEGSAPPLTLSRLRCQRSWWYRSCGWQHGHRYCV